MMLLRARQKWLTPGRKGKCRCTTARGTLHVRIIKLTPLGGIATISTFDSTGLPEDDPGFHDSRMCCRRASCASAITAGWPTAAGAPVPGKAIFFPPARGGVTISASFLVLESVRVRTRRLAIRSAAAPAGVVFALADVPHRGGLVYIDTASQPPKVGVAFARVVKQHASRLLEDESKPELSTDHHLVLSHITEADEIPWGTEVLCEIGRFAVSVCSRSPEPNPTRPSRVLAPPSPSRRGSGRFWLPRCPDPPHTSGQGSFARAHSRAARTWCTI